jgi:hypothetical protein
MVTLPLLEIELPYPAHTLGSYAVIIVNEVKKVISTADDCNCLTRLKPKREKK